MKTNQTRRPVGFNTSWQAQASAPIETATFVADAPQQENLYFIAIAKAMREFLAEEVANYCFSERRLVDKIEAARTLFGDDRKLLKTYFK